MRRIAARPIVWRVLVLASLVVTFVRIEPVGIVLLAEPVWYALQLGPIAVALGLELWQRGLPRMDALGWLLAAFIVLAAVSALWSADPQRTLAQSALLLLGLAFAFVTTSGRWRDPATRTGDLTAVFVVLQVLFLAGLVLLALAPEHAMGKYGRYQGFTPSPITTGLLAGLAVTIGVVLILATTGKPRRALLGVGIGLAAATVVATGARGPLLAFVAAVIVALVLSALRRRTVALLSAAIILATALLIVVPIPAFGPGGYFDRGDQGYDVSSGRIDIWSRLLGVWLTSPFVGVGYRTTEILPGSDGQTAHNAWIGVLVELGVVGLLLFVAVLVAVLVLGWRRTPREWRPLFALPVFVLVSQLNEASLWGFAGPLSLLLWLGLLSVTSPAASTGRPLRSEPVSA